eukprot:TRINITY_DN1831_c0_g2_i7.p1 TRINITY_DN1831_c0_g2~~TRINITY_DN1831_c0_g2_i7.p1  ORF type:complete len:533 (+),score=77.81 TRINITY_DN1831_c0_g2_i7:24-1622(+)
MISTNRLAFSESLSFQNPHEQHIIIGKWTAEKLSFISQEESLRAFNLLHLSHDGKDLSLSECSMLSSTIFHLLVNSISITSSDFGIDFAINRQAILTSKEFLQDFPQFWVNRIFASVDMFEINSCRKCFVSWTTICGFCTGMSHLYTKVWKYRFNITVADAPTTHSLMNTHNPIIHNNRILHLLRLLSESAYVMSDRLLFQENASSDSESESESDSSPSIRDIVAFANTLLEHCEQELSHQPDQDVSKQMDLYAIWTFLLKILIRHDQRPQNSHLISQFLEKIHSHLGIHAGDSLELVLALKATNICTHYLDQKGLIDNCLVLCPLFKSFVTHISPSNDGYSIDTQGLFITYRGMRARVARLTVCGYIHTLHALMHVPSDQESKAIFFHHLERYLLPDAPGHAPAASVKFAESVIHALGNQDKALCLTMDRMVDLWNASHHIPAAKLLLDPHNLLDAFLKTLGHSHHNLIEWLISPDCGTLILRYLLKYPKHRTYPFKSSFCRRNFMLFGHDIPCKKIIFFVSVSPLHILDI